MNIPKSNMKACYQYKYLKGMDIQTPKQVYEITNAYS